MRHDIDPHGESAYVNPVNGAVKVVANISGHRDWAATECPGGTLYAQLPAIRDAVAGSPPPADTTAPVINGISASTTRPRRHRAVVHQRGIHQSGRVPAPRASTWTSSARDPTLATSHTVVVAGLARRTTYEYRVTSADGAGNTTTSVIATFTTTR